MTIIARQRHPLPSLAEVRSPSSPLGAESAHGNPSAGCPRWCFRCGWYGIVPGRHFKRGTRRPAR